MPCWAISAMRSICFLRKRRALGRALDFDELSGPGHDKVHIDIGFAVLFVAKIQKNLAVDNTDAHRGHRILNGIGAENAPFHARRVTASIKRDVSAGDRCRARAAIGLNYVAIDPDSALAESS